MRGPDTPTAEDRRPNEPADMLRREVIATLRLLVQDAGRRQGKVMMPVLFRFGLAQPDREIIVSVNAEGVETAERAMSGAAPHGADHGG